MLTLGVDPGIVNLGFGLIDGCTDPVLVDFGCIVADSEASTAQRLVTLHDGIERILESHPITDLALEQTIFGRNTSTATSVAQASGIVMLCAAQCGIQIAEYSPPQIKNAITGNGNASKRQVQQMVKIILNLNKAPTPHHAADALATAICHVQNYRFNSIITAASQ